MANVTCPNPLKPEDCDLLNKVLHSTHETAELIAKCKRCGITVDEYEAMNNQQRELIQKIKAEFFPHNS